MTAGHPVFGTPVPNGWRVSSVDAIKATDAGSCAAGPFGSNISAKYFEPTGVPVIRGSNLTDDLVQFVDRDFVFVSQEHARKYPKQHVRPGDLVFTCWGTIGQVGLIPDDGPFDEYIISNKQLKLRPDLSVADPHFLFYYFASPAMVAYIRNHAVGSAVPGINLGILKQLPVVLPSLPTQRKIAAILSAYEDLIDNNNERIKILEEMAQRIYCEWFVDFRYAGHETVRLHDSPLGPIPERWRTATLDEVLSVLETGSRPKGGIDPSESKVPSVGAENVLGMGRYEYSKEKFISREFFDEMRRGRVENGDVLLYKDGAYIGRVSLFRDGFPHRECAVNEHVFRLRTDHTYSQSLLYFWLAHPHNNARVRALNSNAAQPGLSQAKLRALTLVLPPPDLVNRFTALVEPIVALLFRLALAVRRAENARDLLLTRLVSGEIDVTDLDFAVPDAGE